MKNCKRSKGLEPVSKRVLVFFTEVYNRCSVTPQKSKEIFKGTPALNDEGVLVRKSLTHDFNLGNTYDTGLLLQYGLLSGIERTKNNTFKLYKWVAGVPTAEMVNEFLEFKKVWDKKKRENSTFVVSTDDDNIFEDVVLEKPEEVNNPYKALYEKALTGDIGTYNPHIGTLNKIGLMLNQVAYNTRDEYVSKEKLFLKQEGYDSVDLSKKYSLGGASKNLTLFVSCGFLSQVGTGRKSAKYKYDGEIPVSQEKIKAIAYLLNCAATGNVYEKTLPDTIKDVANMSPADINRLLQDAENEFKEEKPVLQVEQPQEVKGLSIIKDADTSLMFDVLSKLVHKNYELEIELNGLKTTVNELKTIIGNGIMEIKNQVHSDLAQYANETTKITESAVDVVNTAKEIIVTYTNGNGGKKE